MVHGHDRGTPDRLHLYGLDHLFLGSRTLKEFRSEAAESVRMIQTLRKDLALLDEAMVMRHMELLQKGKKRHNLQQLNDAVLQLKRVVDGVAFCESLVDEGAVERAFDEVDAIELLMAGERDETSRDEAAQIQLRDLREVMALQGVVSDLTTLRSRIGMVCLSPEFTTCSLETSSVMFSLYHHGTFL